MILNYEYDQSLWLVVCNDKKNRNMVIDFIYSIPDDLYAEIMNSADIVNEYRKNNISYWDRKYKELHGSVITSDQLMFWYSIDPYDYGITLGYSVFDGNEYQESFEMTLYPLEQARDDLYDENCASKICDVCNIADSNDNLDKYLIKKRGNGFVICIQSSKREKISNIKFNEIPQDIQFSDLRKGKRLILKRIFGINK